MSEKMAKPDRSAVTGATSGTAGGVMAVGGAVCAALLGWVVAGPLAGVDLAVRPGSATSAPQHVGAATVLVVSLLVSLAGWGLFAVLRHRSSHGRAIWTGVALAVLVLSVFGPLTGGVTTAAKVALVALHLAVAAVLIPSLRRLA